MSAHAEDLALAQRVAAGEQAAIVELWDRYYQRLYKFAYYEVRGSHEDTEDVMQGALVAALRSIGNYRGESPLYSWLCGIVWHKAADFRASEYRQTRIEAEMTRPVREARSRRQRLEDAALLEIDRQRVYEVLERMPPRWRQVLEMKYLRGYRMAEAAALTGQSVKTVESLLTRARLRFRELYQGG